MQRVQIISLVGGTLFLLVILYNVWRKRIREAYALLWVMICVAMIVLSVWGKILDKMAALVGIFAPVNMLFIGFIFGILLLLFQYLILLSRNQEKFSKLVQETALLKEEVERLKAQISGKEKSESVEDKK